MLEPENYICYESGRERLALPEEPIKDHYETPTSLDGLSGERMIESLFPLGSARAVRGGATVGKRHANFDADPCMLKRAVGSSLRPLFIAYTRLG